MKIGDKIARARKTQNLTQEQLAELLNVSRQAVSRWESDIAYPETENLVRLSEILHVNCDYLLKEGVNEDGEKIVEVKIVKEVPRHRELNFRFFFMLAFIFVGAYVALFGTWKIAAQLCKSVAERRATDILVFMGIAGAAGYALIVWGTVLLVSCIRKREFAFKRTE